LEIAPRKKSPKNKQKLIGNFCCQNINNKGSIYAQQFNLNKMAEPKKQVNLKLPENIEAGVYSNAVSVHVNNNEVIIDFGYIIPNMNPTTIKVTSRVNMSHKSAESLMNVLSNAMLDWRNKQKSK